MQAMRAAANAGHPVEFARQWQGQIVDGRFPLEQYLGGSDHDAVFLTRIGNAKAAIRLVRASACDPEARLAAWNLACKLSHPHLIRIFECGRCWLAGNDLLFVVSEFADENLALVLPHRSLEAAEAEPMLREVSAAVEYLHSQGLVHGHICPVNVMAINEQVKLSCDTIQPPGTSLETLEESAYDAPELASRRLSAAADMWSLGATVSEALTQRVPTRAEGLSLPQPFADIVRHTLVRDPAARWNAREVFARLQPSAEGGRDSASSPGKFRTAAWGVIALAVLVIAALLLMRHGSHEHQPVPPESPPAASVAAPATARAVADSSGSVRERVLPKPSRGALGTIQGHVRVRLRINADAGGNVARVAFTDQGPSQYFARLAMQAAEQWKFAPKIRNGQAVPSEWNVLFTYSRGGVQSSEQARP